MGTTGSGKTYKLRELLNLEDRCFLFDLMADPKLDDWGVLCDNLKDACHLAMKSKKFRIRLQFDEVERFDFLCKLLVKKPHGLQAINDCTIAVDELALFCSAQWMPPNFRNVIRLGRHTQARIIATTQRMPDINPFILSQAKEWYVFQMHLPRDMEYLRKIDLAMSQRVLNLQTGEFILWTPQTKESLSAE